MKSLVAAVAGKACRGSAQSRRWAMVDRADATRAYLGGEYRLRADWGGGKRGVVHIKALQLRAWVKLTVAGATNDAISAYKLRALWNSIRIQLVTGQLLCENVDGRQILQDQFFRTGELGNLEHRLGFGVEGGETPDITDDLGLAVDAGAGTYYVPISLTIHLASPSPGRNALRGLVPANLLKGDGDVGMTVQLRNELPGTAPAGVTIDGIYRDDQGTNAGLDCWAELVTLPRAVASGYGRLVTWQETETSGSLKGLPDRSRVAYVAMAPMAEDTAVTLSAITVEADGMLLMKALSADDAETMTTLEEWSRRGAIRLDNAAAMLPESFMYFVPPRDRAAAPVAPVGFSYTRSGGTSVRYLARVIEPLDATKAARNQAALSESCGCGSKATGTNPSGAPCGVTPYEPALLSVKRLR